MQDADVFRLLEWVLMKNKQISETMIWREASLISKLFVPNPFLSTYFLSALLVEKEIANQLPDCFYIMIDGWKDQSIHFCSILTYMYDCKYFETIPACAPLLQEGDLSATQHITFLPETLSAYVKPMSNVMFRTGDNCAVHHKISSLTVSSLIGCY